MTLKEIQELMKLINKLELSEFKMKDGEFELSIRTKNYEKNKPPQDLKPAIAANSPILQVPANLQQPYVPPVTPTVPEQAPKTPQPEKEAAAPPPAQASEKKYLEVRSPIVGTFYRSSSPEKGPYVKVGDTIEAGTVVCIVEAMKLFNEIESEISGKIVKVLVEDASPVEYDQVLFLVDPNP